MIVAGAPYAEHALPDSVPVCIVNVEVARPEAVAVCVSVKSVRESIVSVVPLFR